jgi:hypothetical protein
MCSCRGDIPLPLMGRPGPPAVAVWQGTPPAAANAMWGPHGWQANTGSLPAAMPGMSGALVDRMMASSHMTGTAIRRLHAPDVPPADASRVVPFYVDAALCALLVLSLIGFAASLFVIYLVDEYGLLAN